MAASMVYKLTEIVRDVRIAIDENKTSEQLIADEDIDTLSLNEIIRSKVLEAVRRVLVEAPLILLDGDIPFGDAVYWRDKSCGWILLPCDFLRMFIFKMSDWERPVYEPITAADVEYQLQHSRYKGLRGNPQKPVVAIVSRKEGRVLEFFSCKNNNATVEQASYIKLPEIDDNGGVEIPERCYHAVVYEIAALVLATIEKPEMSTLMSSLSKQLLS